MMEPARILEHAARVEAATKAKTPNLDAARLIVAELRAELLAARPENAEVKP